MKRDQILLFLILIISIVSLILIIRRNKKEDFDLKCLFIGGCKDSPRRDIGW